MARRDLLPGVSQSHCPPAVHVDSRREIRRARWQAALRDLAQILLLGALDYFFLQWPSTHIPLLDRAQSGLILLVLNALFLGQLILMRWIPRWKAQRIARSWCLSERAWFFQPPRI